MTRGSWRNPSETGSPRRESAERPDFEQLPNNLGTLSELEQYLPELPRSTKVVNRLSYVLLGAGFAIVMLGTLCFGALGPLRYESVLLSFGVLVFMSGITLYSWDRKLQGTYIRYLWIAAFIILGSITGFSALGTFVKP